MPTQYGHQKVQKLDETQLQSIVQSSIDLWAQAGLDRVSLDRLKATHYTVIDFGSGSSVLGMSYPQTENRSARIEMDDDAAGWGWLGALTEQPNVAEKMFDPLSVLLHEQGHQLGLEDDFDLHDKAILMDWVIQPLENRRKELKTAIGIRESNHTSLSDHDKIDYFFAAYLEEEKKSRKRNYF
jgi:hypothetical protein